jgi:hypothetical protein
MPALRAYAQARKFFLSDKDIALTRVPDAVQRAAGRVLFRSRHNGAVHR